MLVSFIFSLLLPRLFEGRQAAVKLAGGMHGTLFVNHSSGHHTNLCFREPVKGTYQMFVRKYSQYPIQ